jgi:hypothetical protein
MATIGGKDGWSIFSAIVSPEVPKIADEIVANNGKILCDHCNSVRSRNSYHLFQKEGKIFKIGSKCSQEYFGFDLNRALSLCEGLVNDSDEESMEMGGRSLSSGFAMDSVIDGAKIAYSFDSVWIGAGNDNSTGAFLSEIMYRHDGESRDAKKFRALVDDKQSKERYMALPSVDAIKAKLVEMYSNADTSIEFNWNMKSALLAKDENNNYVMKFLAGFKFGMIGYGVYKALDALNAPKTVVEKSEKKVSEHIGNIGDKVQLKLTVDLVRDMGSFSYNGPVSTLVRGKDENGNVISFFNSGAAANSMVIGSVVEIKGSIKKLEEYKGTKQNVLTRVKVV